jgi:hypothetical protein
MERMSQNTTKTRTSYHRARGRALLKGGGNVTNMPTVTYPLPIRYLPLGALLHATESYYGIMLQIMLQIMLWIMLRIPVDQP